MFAVAILARSIFHVATRGFYARQNTKTPFIISLFSIGATILLSIFFSLSNFGPEGLAMAQSIGAVLEISFLFWILQKNSHSELFNHEFWQKIGRILFSGVICACITYSMTKFLPLMSSDDSIFDTFPKFFTITIAGFISYILAGYLLNLEETIPVINKLKKIIFGNIK